MSFEPSWRVTPEVCSTKRLLVRLYSCVNITVLYDSELFLNKKKDREYIILGECLLILGYQARLRERLLTSPGLPSDSTCVLDAEPGKLDIKKREPGILFISLPS